MAKKNSKKQESSDIQRVDSALSRTEQFFEKYYKILVSVLVGVLVIAAAIVLTNTYFFKPRNVKAADAMAQCVRYFEMDSFNLALNGDGLNEGLLDVIDSYKGSKTADLAKFYAAICYYNLEDYNAAITYLKDCDVESVNATPAKITMIGDCYVAIDDYTTAVKYFEKAGKIENKLTAPRALKKAALCYEELGDWAKAEKCYTTIKETYFDAQEASDIDKYIERCQIRK